MRRPGYLGGISKQKSRSSLGQYAGLGQYGYSLPGGPNNLKASVQYYPAIQELASMPGLPFEGSAHDNKARELCGQIKSKIEGLINKAKNIGDKTTSAEMSAIYQEAKDVEAAVRNEKPPYPEAPLLPMWRKAEGLVGALESKIKAPPPPPPPPPPASPPPPISTPTAISTTTTSAVNNNISVPVTTPTSTSVIEPANQSQNTMTSQILQTDWVNSKTVITILGTAAAMLIISRLLNL